MTAVIDKCKQCGYVETIIIEYGKVTKPCVHCQRRNNGEKTQI